MQSAEATELTAVPVPSSLDWEEDERIAGPQWASVTIIVADVAVLPGAVTHIRRVVRMFPPSLCNFAAFSCMCHAAVDVLNQLLLSQSRGRAACKQVVNCTVGRSMMMRAAAWLNFGENGLTGCSH